MLQTLTVSGPVRTRWDRWGSLSVIPKHKKLWLHGQILSSCFCTSLSVQFLTNPLYIHTARSSKFITGSCNRALLLARDTAAQRHRENRRRVLIIILEIFRTFKWNSGVLQIKHVSIFAGSPVQSALDKIVNLRNFDKCILRFIAYSQVSVQRWVSLFGPEMRSNWVSESKCNLICCRALSDAWEKWLLNLQRASTRSTSSKSLAFLVKC